MTGVQDAARNSRFIHTMQTLRKNAFSLLVAISPFLAGAAAFVHWHSAPIKSFAKEVAVSSCCCGHSHSDPGPADSSLPVTPAHDCNRCLLCQFSAESSWYAPLALEANTETISIPIQEFCCELFDQQIPGLYYGRAPPSFLTV